MKVRDIWATTFCNFGHDMATGRPVGHECYIIPPKCLRLERDAMSDDSSAALENERDTAWGAWSRGPRRTVRGR